MYLIPKPWVSVARWQAESITIDGKRVKAYGISGTCRETVAECLTILAKVSTESTVDVYGTRSHLNRKNDVPDVPSVSGFFISACCAISTILGGKANYRMEVNGIPKWKGVIRNIPSHWLKLPSVSTYLMTFPRLAYCANHKAVRQLNDMASIRPSFGIGCQTVYDYMKKHWLPSMLLPYSTSFWKFTYYLFGEGSATEKKKCLLRTGESNGFDTWTRNREATIRKLVPGYDSFVKHYKVPMSIRVTWSKDFILKEKENAAAKA